MHLFQSLAPYIPLLLAIIRFVLDEIRYHRKQQREKVNRIPEKGNGAYPPRKDKHRKR